MPVSYEAAVLGHSPILWYRMNESSGAVMADSSGNDRDGSYGGSPLTYSEPGAVTGDTSMLFGANAYALVPDAAYLDVSEITLIAWVKGSGFSSAAPILLRDAGSGSHRVISWRLSHNFAGRQTFIKWTAAGDGLVLDGVTNVADDVWHMMAVTHDGTTIRLYVDGVLDASVADPGGLNVSATAGLTLGGDGFRSIGRMDEFVMIGSALTEAELFNLWEMRYEVPLAPPPMGWGVTLPRLDVNPSLSNWDQMALALDPVLFARLGDEVGTEAKDESGFARHGEYSGATLGQPSIAIGLGGTSALLGGSVSWAADATWQLPPQFSALIWAKFTTMDTSGHHIFGVMGSSAPIRPWGIYTNNAGLAFSIADSGSNSAHCSEAPFSLVEDTPYMMTATYDGTTMRLFKNASNVASAGTSIVPSASSPTALTVGRRADGTQPTPGHYQKALLFDYALTPTQISDLHAAGLTA